jgi:hypothetical protein
MNLWQACRAWLNWVELLLMPGGMGKSTLPPEKMGSGKLVIPWERMQAAAFR